MEDNHGDVQEELTRVPISQVVFGVVEQQNQAYSTITTTIKENGVHYSM